MAHDYAIYSVELNDWQVRSNSLRLLSPPGWFIQPMISPDGAWCVFWGRESGETGFNIWRSRTDGSDLQKLTTHQAVSGHPVWCDEGRRIVYSTTWQASEETDWQMAHQFDLNRPARHVWIMDADGGNPRRLTSGDQTDERPTLAADGRWLVFVSNRGGALNLWAQDLQSGELRKLLPGRNHLEYRPIFSHDGSKLAFFLTAHEDDPHVLCELSWPGCELTRFPHAEHFQWIHGPWYLADNRTLLCHAMAKGERQCRIYRLSPDAREPVRIQLPGDSHHAHATVNYAATLLTFDAKPGLTT